MGYLNLFPVKYSRRKHKKDGKITYYGNRYQRG